MSKRVTLTDFEIEQIINGLEELKGAAAVQYEVVRVGKRFYDQIIAKLQPPKPTGEHQ